MQINQIIHYITLKKQRNGSKLTTVYSTVFAAEITAKCKTKTIKEQKANFGFEDFRYLKQIRFSISTSSFTCNDILELSWAD